MLSVASLALRCYLSIVYKALTSTRSEGEAMSRASDHAYDQIRGMILQGTLAPGAHIREEALAEACGVSRTPVRDALRRLEADSFIRRTESQRSYVADWSLDDIDEAFQLRAMLEGHAAQRAATRVSWDQLERMKANNDALGDALATDSPDVQAFLRHNRQFHAIIVEAADSERLAGMLARIVEQPVVLRTAHQYDRNNLLRSHHEHDQLIAAFTCHDGDWAEAVMTSHIRRAFHAYAEAHKIGSAAEGSSLAA
jgi:YD repeat-containing protein